MNLKPPRRLAGATRVVLAALLAVLAVSSTGQQSTIGPIKDFKVPEYYPAPRQNQLRYLLTGAEAIPQGKLVLLKKVQLEKFRENGEQELTVESETCVYDLEQKTISSDAPVKIRTADGAILITGKGFYFQNASADIIIYEKIHTVIQRTPTATGPQP